MVCNDVILLNVDVSDKKLRFKNFVASSGFLLFFYFLYTSHPYFVRYFGNTHYFLFGFDVYVKSVFSFVTTVYFISLAWIFRNEELPKPSKALIAFTTIQKLLFFQSISKTEKTALLAIVVKGFYIPLMLAWFIGHSAEVLRFLTNVYQHSDLIFSDFKKFYQTYLFWLFFKLILFFDVLFFMIGYLIELPILKNAIKSVEPTFFGWAVTLACYPPFNDVTGKFFTWQSSDLPLFDNTFFFYLASFAVLVCMGIYSWASWSLGFKASNLTHRGIVTTGAYALCRHPAYFFKNLAWWIGGLPVILKSFDLSLSAGFYAVFCLSAWSYLYFLRAITEERHLMSVDDDYLNYAQKVKFRFIPFVI